MSYLVSVWPLRRGGEAPHLLDGGRLKELLALGLDFGGQGPWAERYRQLLTFCAQQPLSELEALTAWLRRQRREMRRGRLESHGEKLFES